MRRLIRFLSKNGDTIMVVMEEPEIEDEEPLASGPGGIVNAQQTFEEAVSKIRPVFDSVIDVVEGIPPIKRPDEFQVEFEVGFNGKTGIIMTVGAEANFKVNMTWKKK